ncbi:hypothetical protein AgCh_005916 [Apium graveolens]
MDVAIAPYSYYVGRGMSTDEARSLVVNAKLEASDRSELQFDLEFDCNIVDKLSTLWLRTTQTLWRRKRIIIWRFWMVLRRKREKNEDLNEGLPLDLDKLDDLEKDSVEEEKNYNLDILYGSPEKEEKNEDLNEGVTSNLVKLDDLEKEAKENNLDSGKE